MKKILNQAKEIINRTWFKIAIINIGIFVIANILYSLKYEQIDDMIMYGLYSGLDGTYNIHGVYIHPVICFILSMLFRICPSINWHTIFLLSMQFICFTTIGTILVNKSENNKLSYITYSVFASVCYLSLLLLIQYTSVAALLIATAFFIIFDITEKSQKNNKKLLFAITLFAIGIMTRMQSILIIAPFFAIYFIYKLTNFIKNKTSENKRQLFSLLKKYIVIALITAIVYISNILIYNSNEIYKNYIEYNNLRAELQDLSYTNYEENKEIFDEIGWSKNDHYLFYTFNYGDENVYSKENLQKIVDYKKSKGEQYNLNTNIENVWENLVEPLRNSNKYISIMLFVACILAIYTNDKYKIFSGIILITTIGINVLFIVLNRAMLRVVIPEYILGIALLLYYIKYNNNEKINKKIYMILAISILIVTAYSGETYEFNYNLNSFNSYAKVIKYTNEHKENTYLYTAPALQFRYLAYSVYEMPPKGAFSNLRVLGGWDIFTQNYYNFKEKNNLQGTFEDLLKDNVYLIDGDVSWSGVYYQNYKQHIIQFIKEHYGKNAKCEKIQTIDNVYIYKLTEDNEK